MLFSTIRYIFLDYTLHPFGTERKLI